MFKGAEVTVVFEETVPLTDSEARCNLCSHRGVRNTATTIHSPDLTILLKIGENPPMLPFYPIHQAILILKTAGVGITLQFQGYLFF